jgi:hypothetical protein
MLLTGENVTDRGESKYLKENMSQYHFVSHMDWPGIAPGPPRFVADDAPPESWRALLRVY